MFLALISCVDALVRFKIEPWRLQLLKNISFAPRFVEFRWLFWGTILNFQRQGIDFIFSLRCSKEVLLVKTNISTASCELLQLRPEVILA